MVLGYGNHGPVLSEQSFPTCEQAAGEILSLPMYPQLTKEDVQTVTDRIVQWTASYELCVLTA
jgi:dTDP-4-amino-4,6-dideoxygalactose transaminase